MLRVSKFFFVGLVISFVGMACIVPIDGILTAILQRLKIYQQYRPQQKIYIHFDRPFYAAGEDIWFSTYVVNAALNTPDSSSKVVYVELFDAKKKMLLRRALYSPNGTSHGDFHLDETLPSGNYVVRAYTNYMKNFDEDFFFVKEVAVMRNNALPSSETVLSDSDVDVQFFPEGGIFLSGVENRVAFKATDRYGRGVAIQGEILDESNTVITTYLSEHAGMGMFRVTPVYGKQYHAHIKNKNVELALPEVVQKSYLLKTMDLGPFIKVIVYSDRKKFSQERLPIYVVAQANAVVSFAVQGEIVNSSIIINIPKSKLPSGITQITLLDGQGIPQCERLVFINHEDVLQFEMTQDTVLYGKREKVSLDVHVSGNGKPAQGYFSLSVYDETRIKDQEKYPSSIVSQLLLMSDLKGRIEEPGYYFKDTTMLTKQHADLLMMTHGWRRFIWKDILADTLRPVSYYPEQGIVISGKLLKSITNKPAKNSDLKILTSGHDLLILKTDSLGRFYSDNLIYFDSTELFMQTDNARGKQTDMKLQLDPFNPSTPLNAITLPMELPDAMAFLEQTKIINQIADGYKKEEEATLLKAVEIKAKKEEFSTNTSKIYGIADATVNMKDIPQGYTNILQALQGRVAGVSVMGNPPTVSIRGGGEPLFLLNGMQVDFNMISNIPVNDVESIDVLKGVSASIYGGRGGNGVIAIYTKKGGYSARPAIGIHNLKYPGFYKAREFYSPKYDVAEGDKKVPDIRNTLYWNPSIKTDNAGHAKVSFFTSDIDAGYRIVIEGISTNGMAGTGVHHIMVK